MQSGKRNLIVAAAASLLTFTGRVLAHGDQKHPANSGPAKKEQKDWGIAGDAGKAKRSIDVGMSDNMRFTPDRITVKLGETVRFVARNDGMQLHEFVIGTKAENDKHAALMLKFPGMEHDEPYMAHVPPGKTGQIVWTFNRAGQFEFACLIAGHYQAGMVGTVTVTAATNQQKRTSIMNTALATLLAATFALVSAPTGALADDAQPKPAATASADDGMTDGEVRKVDLEAGKLTLKHAEIKSLDMPAMTMVFAVRDKAMLAKLKAGDRVRFKAVNDGGKFTLTEIQPAK